MNKRIRVLVSVILIIITFIFFGFFVKDHQNLISQIRNTKYITIFWLLLLYIAWFMAIVFIIKASLKICRISINIKDNILLNAYSTLINFFIPGQGGTIARGAYLKKVKGIKVRKYILVTILYYMIYAGVSGFILLLPERPVWQAILFVGGIIMVSWLIIHAFIRKDRTDLPELELTYGNIFLLVAATLFQAIVQVAIYGVELHSVNNHIGLSQMISYTGAANFALFVALTPGAIGIRESFLIFSKNIHHISSINIVAANVIDRAVFFIVLACLFILTLVIHVGNSSAWKRFRQKSKPEYLSK